MSSCKTYIKFLALYLCAVTAVNGGCPPMYSRKDWGAETVNDREKMSEPTQFVALHHTYIPGICKNFEECKRAMKSMQNYHKNELKWGDIGYSFCIGGDGKIYEGRGWGIVGAHTLGWNKRAVGVCLIGDFNPAKPSPAMLKAIDDLTQCGVQQGHLSKNFKYFGHLQTSATECPGKAFYEYIKKMPRWIKNPK